MQINLVYDASVNAAPTGFKVAAQMAANIIDQQLGGTNISVALDLGWGEDDGQPVTGNTLAEAQPSGGLFNVSYATLKAALLAHPTSAADRTFLASLPATDPSGGGLFFIPYAQAYALDLTIAHPASGIDGFVGVSSNFTYTFDDTNGVAAGTYDLVDILLHEMTHALGRYEGLTTSMTLAQFNPQTGARDLTLGPSERDFSIDGGKTTLAVLNGSSDPADLDSPAGDSFDAFLNPGVKDGWTSTDQVMMETLGFAPPAPAPPTTIYVLTAGNVFNSSNAEAGDTFILDAGGSSATIGLSSSSVLTFGYGDTLAVQGGACALNDHGNGTHLAVAAGTNVSVLGFGAACEDQRWTMSETGVSAAALIASARPDGAGGTVFGTSGSSIDLLYTPYVGALHVLNG